MNKNILLYRFQLLWIIFTAAYLILGKNLKLEQDNLTELSSVMMTTGMVIITALMYNILFEEDLKKSQPVILVILTACIFLLSESYSTYKDLLGSVFILFIAILCSVLSWAEDSFFKKN
ncbi:hypothetical protein L4D13_01125 [Photobacterium profundum]|uniref:hypothetical protein n=1 Tax=Photobacterium profundum TaxID=74109 RepID=UPI003D0C7704